MPVKTKITKPEKVLEIAQQAGLILMTAAVTLGMMEMPDRNSRVIIPNQPSFAMANEQNELNNNSNNMQRRENEESEKSYISYSVTQRTPARSGRT